MAPTQVSPEEEDEWALTPRDRSMMGRVSSRILCWAEAEEEMPDKKDLPSWMAPKHLRHTKRLVQAARAKDQVQVLRGTNQKKQLEQRAWELVFNMFLLKPKMEEELKKEQERVLSEAVEKGHDASSLEIMVEDSSGIRRPMQMQLQRTFSRGGGALGPGGMYRSRSMHPGADSQSFIRRSRSRLSSITDLTQSSFIARTRSAGGEWAAVQTASFIARTRPGDRSAPSKLEDICVPQLQRGDAGFALSGMASIVESMPEGASHSKPLELNVVPFDGLDSLRGGSTDNLDGPPQVVRLFVREEVMTYKMKYETAKRDLFELLKNEESQREEPDPVGAIPLHACFLLGLSDIGQELVEEFYHEGLHRCDLNTPYTSDLEPWKKLGVLDKDDPYDDGGLYTGETCLHIAIVQSKEEDTRLVSWMLEHGAQVHARATGAFFKGKVIKFRADHNENSSKWWRRAAALWLRLTSGAFQTDHGYRCVPYFPLRWCCPLRSICWSSGCFSQPAARSRLMMSSRQQRPHSTECVREAMMSACGAAPVHVLTSIFLQAHEDPEQRLQCMRLRRVSTVLCCQRRERRHLQADSGAQDVAGRVGCLCRAAERGCEGPREALENP